MSITLLLADDHDIIRYGVRLLLECQPDIEVVGEARTGVEVLSQVEALEPQMLLLDLGMPGGCGPAMITELRTRRPQLRIVVLSMYRDQSHVLGALRAGASAYVLKEGDTDDIVEAIREVAAGRRYLCRELAERALDGFVDGQHSAAETHLRELTERELEIIRKAAEGTTSAEIAHELFISPRTVETHRSRAMQKLGLRNHVELVRFFVNLELARADD